MASTYSNLKIQLMATGENNSTWGTVTNTNLGTAIEEAITGSVDVTFASGDVTLTLTNTNATQSARNLRLNCTGTTGGARNLVLGSGCQIEKVYIVNNGCADAITVKNTTGTGIAVPAGKTMYVFNNGTNVVDAITHLTSLTLGSALAIADGGTGSNTATFSGANISNLNGSNVSSGTIANARTTASSSNGTNTIVSRGASGEFAAGTITATFSGDGSAVTSINASNISSGTIANARTTASSSNGASTIVARDASGNFSAGTITANITGNLTGTASNATVLQTSRNFEISGGATASAVSFNGSGNVNLSVTGLNVSTANAGTLAVGRGGTGITSAGTSGNVLSSDGSAWVSAALSSLSGAITPTTGNPAYYGARAWVNFNGTGTIAIRQSANVSSLTDNGVGDYTINFSTSMPDTEYAAFIKFGNLNMTGSSNAQSLSNGQVYNTGSYRFGGGVDSGPALYDSPVLNVVIFR